MMKYMKLLEVDEVKITIIMDNTVDVFMNGNEIVHRFNLNCEFPPIAEHGFSAMIQVKSGDKQGNILLDAGISTNGILHNIDSLGVNVSDIQAVVLSHGHSDHTMGLPALIERLGKDKIPLIAHPDAFLDKKIIMPDGYELNISPAKLTSSQEEKITPIKKVEPSLLVEDMILVSGEIPRATDFETGFSLHYIKRNNNWENDPVIKDDQCVIVNVREKGLVIITGCGHSGIINTIRYAQELTNTKEIYAVLGGFHLTGGIFEKIIPNTICELKKINPKYLMPGHCTGWSAIHQIAKAMPNAFIPNNVGTTLVFKGK